MGTFFRVSVPRLRSIRAKYNDAADAWRSLGANDFGSETFYADDGKKSRAKETKKKAEIRKRGMETLLVLQQAATDYEDKLNILERWTPNDAGYVKAVRTLDERRFRAVIEQLCGAVIARLQELAKKNRGDVGTRRARHRLANELIHTSIRIQVTQAHRETTRDSFEADQEIDR